MEFCHRFVKKIDFENKINVENQKKRLNNVSNPKIA